MTTIFLPKNVADAIETSWTYMQSVDPTVVKYIVLNDWSRIGTCCADEVAIMKPYAQANPVNYMQALVNGYEIEFQSDKTFTAPGISITYSGSTIGGNATDNFPIKLQVNSDSVLISVEEAKDISDNINAFIQELSKIRSDI